MRDDVVTRLRATIAEHGLGALVCLSPENVAYTAGFVIPSQSLMRWRHAATVIHADGRQAVVCVDMEETTVRAHIGEHDEVRVWKEFVDKPMAILARLLLDWGLGSAAVGTELDYLSADDHAQLMEYAPDIRLVAAGPLLTEARQPKTPSELVLLEQLSRISDTAIKTAFEAVRAGSTEMDIAAALTRSVYEQGAQQFKLMIVATGERSQLPNVGPTMRTLIPGDICRVEIFSVIDGYQAGVCRTAVVGEASAKASEIYANLVECKHAVFDAIRPGASSRSVYDLYRGIFNRLGLPAISFVAHSIGVNLHEAPYFGPYSDHVIREGMVLGMEPLVYRSGHGFGMQIKDMIAVESDGARLLSDVTDTDTLFQIAA
ncbi:MAG: aminopeptidase P family protein [Microbacteriaceae bacterium]|nr:MAG: aminopeptidase P family protein [Microbacteriaceae bacterium]